MKLHRLILEGLDCAHCASKVERAVAELSDVENVELNFMQKTLCFKAPDSKLTEIHATILAIEPDVTIQTEPNDEKEPSPRMTIIRIITSAILLVLAHLLPFSNLILLFAYIIVGADVLIHAFKNIIRGKIFDENFLMAIATVGAIAIGEFSEAVGVMLFYQVGELFQSLAVNRSRRSIRALLDIRPDFANLKTADGIRRISPSDIAIDDIIVINPGERIPLDAVVTDGDSQVDTSAITGEPVPRTATVGDTLISGCVNLNGVLHARVTHTFSQSTANKILELVEHATAKKSKPENFITKFARVYTPAVIFSALALALIPPVFGADFKTWLYRALMFLVISCPCALVVSVPLSFFSGIGRASKNGILVKGSNYLDALAQVKTVVFDKTGTLTHGIFTVSEIISDRADLLEITALAESASPHPIAASVREAYAGQLDPARVSDIRELPGRGVSAKVDGKSVLAGNAALLQDFGITHPDISSPGTLVFVAIDQVYAGCITIADKIKAGAKDTVSHLRAQGVQNLVMLSGDRKNAAESCAASLGIDTVFSELLPADKLTHIEKLLKRGTLAFVGDGMNDAPSLARADIGIAMGALGTDAAIEAADVVLMTDELASLTKAIDISRKTRSIVMQNIIFVLVIKALFLLLGALGIANMWTAVFADVGVSVIAILNAMRAM